MAAKTTYTVVQNIPGYLPMDDEPATLTSKREAMQYAAQMAREVVDSYREIDRPVRKSGDAWRGYHIVDPADPYDLGIAIDIQIDSPCLGLLSDFYAAYPQYDDTDR